MDDRLTRLEAGMPVPFGGDRVTFVPAELAEAFRAGDRLVVVQETGDLLHIPRSEWDQADGAVSRASEAFARMGTVTHEALDRFYESFADRLADDDHFEPIGRANQDDVARARERGRSTTRLSLSADMRAGMIAGLRTWKELRPETGPVEVVRHQGWRVEQHRAGLGVVGFVFEGRPNVFADATGVLRSGNTVVFRIGSDALETARALVAHALDPALESAGLPPGAVSLVDSRSRAAGWAMFSDSRLALAVARGSGPAVAQLGAVARQAGTPVSLHGTGGAWLVVSGTAGADDVSRVVRHSLDRKVCNTLNTVVMMRDRLEDQLPAVLAGLDQAAADHGTHPKAHVVGDMHLPAVWSRRVPITRSSGTGDEPMAEPISPEEAGREWEWEDSPEVTLLAVDDLDEAIDTFNRISPRFVASLLSRDPVEHDLFFARIDAPFVGDGFTRWVDGQYALDRPELGLSNWQWGRLLARGAILSGDSVHTIRTRASFDDLDVSR
jgi:glutamate-5-semialdehyde dehydrogenase